MARTVTAQEAAEVLGITPRAVKMRIQKGTLEAHMHRGKWWVTLPEPVAGEVEEPPEEEQSGMEAPFALSTSTPGTALEQLVVIQHRQLVELARENGRLAAELDRAQQDIDTLTDALHQLSTEDPPPNGTPAGFWQRLWARIA